MLLPSVLLLELEKSSMVIWNGDGEAADWAVVEGVIETDGTVEGVSVNKDGIVSDVEDGIVRDAVFTESRDCVDADDEDRLGWVVAVKDAVVTWDCVDVDDDEGLGWTVVVKDAVVTDSWDCVDADDEDRLGWINPPCGVTVIIVPLGFSFCPLSFFCFVNFWGFSFVSGKTKAFN